MMNFDFKALLNFDTTFFFLVLSAMQKNTECKDCACPYHFGRKRTCKTGIACDFVSDVTVLLTCLKFDDDIKDDKSLRAKFFKKLFSPTVLFL